MHELQTELDATGHTNGTARLVRLLIEGASIAGHGATTLEIVSNATFAGNGATPLLIA